MAYRILERDGTSHIEVNRYREDAADKKALELKQMGWFEVEVREDKAGHATALTDRPPTLQ